MLKVKIVAVGGIKESFYRDAIEEYRKRLGKWAKAEIEEVAEASQVADVLRKKEEEGEAILRKLKGRVILTDVKGRHVSSEGLSEILSRYAISGSSEITFVIGGSNGVSDRVKAAADEIISFGDITMPHQLFRVVLMEQIYRSLSIVAGTPYHK